MTAEPDLYRLVYASRNLLQGEEAETAAAVAQILAASRRNNVRAGVTGALLFNGGAFAQVLEGARRDVEDTFERIQRDDRHSDVTVLQCGPAEARGFSDWSMAFVGQSERGRALWGRLASGGGLDLSRLDGDAVFAMLHGLVLEEEGLAPDAAGTGLLPPAPAVPAGAPPEPDAARDAPEDGPPRAIDVARIRSEIADLRPEARGAAEAGAPAVPREDRGVPRDAAAALAVLRTSLGHERALTTELRDALDEARIALALEREALAALRAERDLWAERARLLAAALGQEAALVAGTGAAARPSGTRAA